MCKVLQDTKSAMDSINQDSLHCVISMTRKELHELVRASPQRLLDGKFQDLDKKLVEMTKCPAEKNDELFKTIKSFKAIYKRKWLYSWQPMSPTVHKILVHSSSIISHALLPIGQLSEEAAEARNKHFRLYRESFSRKFSRKACNEDVLNRLLLTSDPFISSRQSEKKRNKNKQAFTKEATAFFIPEDETISDDE